MLSNELVKTKQLIRDGRIKEALKLILEFEKKYEPSDQELLLYYLIKGTLYNRSSRYLDALDCSNRILEQRNKLDDLSLIFDALLIKGYALIMSGNLSQSEAIIKDAEELFEKLKNIPNVDIKERESFMLRTKACIEAIKGDFHLSRKLNEKAYELAKETEDKHLIISSLINLGEVYQYLGDYDKALFYAKSAVDTQYPLFSIMRLGTLIDCVLGKGDIKNAKYYFSQMERLMEFSERDTDSIIYRYYKALILKTSLRAKSSVDAEAIFKKINEEKKDFQIVIKSLLQLCSLMLIELRITNDLDIINEIKHYTIQLSEFIHREQSYWFSSEIYLLQAKLALLTFNFTKAKRLLFQAQKIAERMEYRQFDELISDEIENLLQKSDSWEKLKEIEAPMADRIELAQLDELILRMTQKSIVITFQFTEEKVAVSKEKKVCLVCRGDVLRFSYICECGAIYCQKCAQAITDLENVCWLCDKRIDYSKPIKEYEEIKEGAKNGKKVKK
ncbi:MAG: tetratricopeptide repeat protein [Promethearchaeota archaeon]